ncbi:tyrosine protein phosphatase [Bombilactobacillus folatiphilus]|uniref:Tyrosine-protein phosphatase n=1 Tax=Bombilactobacillus folatiphilus TaxID=2923362 RepID=A0ABY4P7Z8_9LACO|nr:CpsB/CapC family capsule biosynthesis tyrosine phosphatase [Bombilactobacillus folatiphilus]UQS81720.1 tyrosine protein phosphatase [Bombilactobacillus folatiphilus]
MTGLVDLHCHLLPHLDDGPDSVADSLALARVAVQQGITQIVCTPHDNHYFHNSREQVTTIVTAFQQYLTQQQINLELLPGQELYLDAETLTKLAQDQLSFIDPQKHYLLIEFPEMEVPNYALEVISELIARQITPIIVHPERNGSLIKNPNELFELLSWGCLAQVSAGSLLGKFGLKVKKTGWWMLKRHAIQFVASDAHGIQKRTFCLREAYQKIARRMGEAQVAQLQSAAQKVINGQQILL